MKNESLNGGSGCKTFIVADTLLKKYNGNDENLRLPGFIYAVGNRAFAGNEVLKSVSFSDSVAEIGESAFSGCSSLELIVFNGTKELWFAVRKGDNWLDGTAELVIRCKDGEITKREELEIEAEPRADINSDDCQNDGGKVLEFVLEKHSQFLERRRRELKAEAEDDEDDEELDRKFEEYEKFLNEQLAFFDDEDDDEDEQDNSSLDKIEQLVHELKTVSDKLCEELRKFRRGGH